LWNGIKLIKNRKVPQIFNLQMTKKVMNLFDSINRTVFSVDRDEGYLGAVEKHFKERLENLKFLLSLRNESRDLDPELFILACCFLDAFANIFYGSDPGLRFRKILYEFAEYGDVDFSKVSLIELEKIFLMNKQFIPLKKAYLDYIGKKIDNIDYSAISHSYKYDPLKHDLLKELLSIENNNFDLLRDAIENATYASVLYTKYRNPVIHEGIPKNHWNIADENYLYYMGIIDARADLVFSAKFLVNLLESIYKKVFERILSSESF